MTGTSDLLDKVRFKFPNISEQASVTSPETSKYNCIAYAAGDSARWWWPDGFGMAYWPTGVVRSETALAFQMAFETLGYELCADESLEGGYEKVVFYHISGTITHAARQIVSGQWISKLGRSYDIHHNVSCLQGAEYGEPAFFMRRKLSG